MDPKETPNIIRRDKKGQRCLADERRHRRRKEWLLYFRTLDQWGRIVREIPHPHMKRRFTKDTGDETENPNNHDRGEFKDNLLYRRFKYTTECDKVTIKAALAT